MAKMTCTCRYRDGRTPVCGSNSAFVLEGRGRVGVQPDKCRSSRSQDRRTKMKRWSAECLPEQGSREHVNWLSTERYNAAGQGSSRDGRMGSVSVDSGKLAGGHVRYDKCADVAYLWQQWRLDIPAATNTADTADTCCKTKTSLPSSPSHWNLAALKLVST